MVKNVGIIVGSLRKGSLNKIIANKVATLFPKNIEVSFLEIGNLPLYNEDFDLENRAPETYNRFREEAKAQDAFIFVTPEYNRSLPASIKNAIDVGSRPWGKSVWTGGKAAYIISVSPSSIGGALANHALRQALVFNDTPVMQQPEAYINASHAIDDNGEVATGTVEFLQEGVNAFLKFANRFDN